MVTFTLNDEQVQAEEGATVLEAATAQGVHIPTLCYHEGLPPYGACRLCMVEVSQRGRAKLESACTRPVEDGMEVRTDTNQVQHYRQLIAELLLARCPDSERIQEVAREVGVTKTRFTSLDEDCVLCGLCVRACQDAIGASAISFTDRGIDRKVRTPMDINSDVCIGCGACASVCPTDAIKIEDTDGKRYLRYFNTELELQPCEECGAYFATKRALARTAEEYPVADELRDLCDTCRRKHLAASLQRHLVP